MRITTQMFTNNYSNYMSVSISKSYNQYKPGIDKRKNCKYNTEKSSVSYSDCAEISEDGKKALEHKMAVLAQQNIPDEVRKLASVSSFGYCNDFEKALSEFGNSKISEDFTRKNVPREKVDGVKPGFETDERKKTDCFDYHVNKMVSVYSRMQNRIEEKYANTDYEQEYYVSDDGSILELTKEKELEMLDEAYGRHSIFMATNTEIWGELKDFRPQITCEHSKTESSNESENLQKSSKTNEIKN